MTYAMSFQYGTATKAVRMVPVVKYAVKLGNAASGYLPDIYDRDVPGMPKMTTNHFFEQVSPSVRLFLKLSSTSRPHNVEISRMQMRRTKRSEAIYWVPSARTIPKSERD